MFTSSNEEVDELSFSGRSHSDEPADLVHGDVGATQLEILQSYRHPRRVKRDQTLSTTPYYDTPLQLSRQGS